MTQVLDGPTRTSTTTTSVAHRLNVQTELRGADYAEKFRRYLVSGDGRDLPQLSASILSEVESRAQEVGSQILGGFWVPDSWQPRLVLAANDASPIRRAAAEFDAILTTPSGSDAVWPTVDDSAVDGVLLAENAESAQTDIATIGALTCPSYMFHSRTLLVSFQLLLDAGPQVEDYLAAVLGRRIARAENTQYTIGAGADRPQGLVPAASVGVTAAATGGITADNLVDLIDSADPEWRFAPSAMFSMASATYSAIRRLKDSTGRYLVWAPDPTGTGPGSILGRQVVINRDMPVMAASNRSVVYYDTGRFIIRDVVPAGLVVLRQLFARNAQQGFMLFQRHGSVLQTVGTVPAAVALVQAA